MEEDEKNVTEGPDARWRRGKTEAKRYIWPKRRGRWPVSIFTGFPSTHDFYTAAINAYPRRQIYSGEGYFLILTLVLPSSRSLCIPLSFVTARSTGRDCCMKGGGEGWLLLGEILIGLLSRPSEMPSWSKVPAISTIIELLSLMKIGRIARSTVCVVRIAAVSRPNKPAFSNSYVVPEWVRRLD